MSEVKDILRKLRDIPRSDYRFNSEPLTEPSGMLKGGIRLIDEFAKLSFPHITELELSPALVINRDVQLYLTNDTDYIDSAARAVFPLFEPKYIGLGGIYLGRYATKDEKIQAVEMKIRKAELFFLSRENPDIGHYITVQDSKHKEERYYALYRIGKSISPLIQFGIDRKGWFTPKLEDEKRSLIIFPGEERTYIDGVTFDVKQSTHLVMESYDCLKRAVRELGITFKDDWAKSGSLQLDSG